MLRNLRLFSAALVVLTILATLLVSPVAAETTYFVRTDGSDLLCNGKANNPAANAPNCAFATIQKAVTTAASGDTIRVAAGTYIEQVTIGKSLTLHGPGATIKAPPVVVPFATLGGFQNAIVLVNNNAKVAMTGFTISGPFPGTNACADENFGIFIGGNATVDLRNVTVTQIKDASTGLLGCQSGVGIQVGRNFQNEVGHLIGNNVTVTDYQKNGITTDKTGSTINLDDSTVTGVGSSPYIAQNGIQIGRGANGTVRNTTVSNNRCDLPTVCGPDPANQTFATGFLLFGSGKVTLIDNTIKNNDVGLYNNTPNSSADGLKILNNRFEGVYGDEGKITVDNSRIVGGNIGVLAISFNDPMNPPPPTANSVVVLSDTSVTGAVQKYKKIEQPGAKRAIIIVEGSEGCDHSNDCSGDNNGGNDDNNGGGSGHHKDHGDR